MELRVRSPQLSGFPKVQAASYCWEKSGKTYLFAYLTKEGKYDIINVVEIEVSYICLR